MPKNPIKSRLYAMKPGECLEFKTYTPSNQAHAAAICSYHRNKSGGERKWKTKKENMHVMIYCVK